MVTYARLCIEDLTSKMASLGLRHSKKITLPFWFMVVWPPLWLKNTESAFFSKKNPSLHLKLNADQEFYNFMGSEIKSE